MSKKANGPVGIPDSSDPTYVYCPICFDRIFEKNLRRHNNSNRCAMNSKVSINGNRVHPLLSDKKPSFQNTGNKSMLNVTLMENQELQAKLIQRDHEILYTNKSFAKMLQGLKECLSNNTDINLHKLTVSKFDKLTQTDDIELRKDNCVIVHEVVF